MSERLIANIQVMRAVAAGAVLVSHALDAAADYGPQSTYLTPLRGVGAAGVDIFFVISGFLMLHIQNISPRSPARFFGNRLARIVPLYWIMTIVLFFCFLIMPSMFRSLQIDLGRTIKSLLFIASHLDSGPVIYIGWTLEAEVAFYSLFALSLYLGEWAWPFRVAALLMITAYTTILEPNRFSSIWLEFLIGMACAELYRRQAEFRAGKYLIGVGILLFAATIPHNGPSVWRGLIWGVPSGCILLGSLYAKQTGSRLAMYLGASSYACYLAHPFVVPVFYKIAGRHLSAVNGDAVVLLAVGFSVAIGCAVYEAIEKPAAKILAGVRAKDKVLLPLG